MLWFYVTMISVLFTMTLAFPSPKRRNPFQGPPIPPTPKRPEPELEHDPSAFWRYPDWESGPIEEPFWMRPLALPNRFDNRENYSGESIMPVIFGQPRIEGHMVTHFSSKNGIRTREYVPTVEACGVCKMMKYGGWAGDWCDGCDDDTPSIHIPKTEAVARKVVRPNR